MLLIINQMKKQKGFGSFNKNNYLIPIAVIGFLQREKYTKINVNA